MHHSHSQKILSCSYVGTLDAVTKENIADNQEVNVAAMSRDYNERAFTLTVILDFSNVTLIDHYLLVNSAEQLV